MVFKEVEICDLFFFNPKDNRIDLLFFSAQNNNMNDNK